MNAHQWSSVDTVRVEPGGGAYRDTEILSGDESEGLDSDESVATLAGQGVVYVRYFVYTYTHARTHQCTHACTRTHMHTCMDMHTHIHTHKHAHTHTHTHTHTPA